MKIAVLHVLIEAQFPVVLGIQGSMPEDRSTLYFDRTYTGTKGDFIGQKWFEFPLPVTRDGVRIRAFDRRGKQGVEILDKRVAYREPMGLDVDSKTYEFLHFALGFCRNLTELPEGVHQSSSGEFRIRLRRQIRSYVTGNVIGTPARVNHETKIMEVGKEDFMRLTLPNRYFILLHEYYHVLGNTKNEYDCDRFALKVMLRLGFSKTECLYSLSKLFQSAGHNTEREKRVRRAKDYILVFQDHETRLQQSGQTAKQYKIGKNYNVHNAAIL